MALLSTKIKLGFLHVCSIERFPQKKDCQAENSNYQEFGEKRSFQDESDIRKEFTKLDADNSGFITKGGEQKLCSLLPEPTL